MGAAAAPMLIGSAIGAATSKNPLQGALMGGMLGGAGSAFMGGTSGLSSLLSGTGSTASGVLPSALSGSTTINAVTPMAGQAFVNPVATSLTTGPSISANIANEATKQGLFAGSPVTKPFVSSGTSTGLIPSSMYEPTFMDRLGSVGQYAQQNPYLTQMGMQSAQQMMQQPQAQFAPAGQIQRGGIQDVQIASALPQAPRISLI
jgi:hypothetical protein